MKVRRLFIMFILIIFISNISYAQDDGKVYVVPIKGEINRATSNFISDVLSDINQEDADAIIFEIDTYGGLIEEAQKIKDAIIATNIPTISFVNNNAQSAGVLITIASENIVMANNSSIGSAETIPNNEKVMSMWRAVLRDTARYRDRESMIIEAMADKDIFIEGISEKGKLINLTGHEAVELGVADYTSNDYNDILEHFNIETSEIVEVNEGLQVKLAKYISNTYISSLLLALGFIGLVIEIFTPGFGIGGTVSIIGFGLYFGGNILAGNSNWTSLALFVIGLILLVIEGTVPGFGLPGIGGIVFILIGTIIAMDNLRSALISLSIAIILTTLVSIYIIKLGYRSKIFDNIILNNRLNKEKGYISLDSMDFLLEKEGTTISDLRPAGFIEIDGKKYDALSAGDYIEKNTDIKVTKVEGAKIFVRRG
ncbi:nodulation protein NfeD [Tissierella sp. Yu-01]|uniref:NfeD family protein n=1 Tax=Tissierella sp. Yu-01 TaxID=3035694 RepID=UPI00240E4B0B|nr:nodulation protein NfeD [Tissierella sp. Yu-01]WFA09546.1 nodulation protein NfeD [Tissierella sp. Yu-01]